MEGQKEARGIKLGSWNKSNNTKMEMDSETYPGSRSTHIPFSGCERTLTQPDWLRPIIWQKSGLCISPHSLLYPSSLKHQVLLYGSSLNWVFILMHKRTWQMCHYLVGAISSAAWLLSFTWKTDCWSKGIETRAGGKAPLREFWIPRGHLSTAEDDLPLLSRQRVKKKTETVTWWLEAYLLGPWLARGWSYIDNYNYRQPVPRNHLVSHLHYLIFYKTTD